jgi:membrane protease YdiL (CAAX protease family)
MMMQPGDTAIEGPGPAPRTPRGRIVATIVLLFFAAMGLGLNWVMMHSSNVPMMREADARMSMFQGTFLLRLTYCLERMKGEGAPSQFAGGFAGKSARTGAMGAARYFEKASRAFATSEEGAPALEGPPGSLPPRNAVRPVMDPDDAAAAAASAAALYAYLGDDWRALRTLQPLMDTEHGDALSLMARLYANQRPAPDWLGTKQFTWIVRHVPAHLLIELRLYERLGRADKVRQVEDAMEAVGTGAALRVGVLMILGIVLALAGLIILARGVFGSRGFGPYAGLPERPWGIWEGLELVAAWLVLWMVLVTGASVAAAIVFPRALAEGIGWLALTYVPYALAAFLIVLWFVVAVAPRGTGLRSIGWRPAKIGASIANGIGAYAAALPVVLGMSFVALRFFPQSPPNPVEAAMTEAHGWGARLVFLFVLCVLAPVVEETLFRGGLYGGMRKRWSLPAAALASGAMFAAVHLSGVNFVPILALGVALAMIYERTGSLVPGMIAHGVFNLGTAVVIFTLA